MERVLDRILLALRQAYRDFEHPEYHFVGKALAAGQYDDFVELLAKEFSVSDHREPNTDVARKLRIVAIEGVWILWLSYIGPFACLLEERSMQLVLAENGTARVAVRVREACQLAGLELLDADTLERMIPMTLYVTKHENVRVFHALFSDIDVLPWEPWDS